MNPVSVTPQALSQFHHAVTQVAAEIGAAPLVSSSQIAPLAITLGLVGSPFLAALEAATTRHHGAVTDHGARIRQIAEAIDASRAGYMATDAAAARSIARGGGVAA